ncbi:hypothetical protein AVV36_gp158 [Pectobacterium bacteriophage PM2]|uniref:Uncharacterized protein n=1 Tax=Pectobacterium bacteriophage PM2 TaxID=1429794 RepID=A0A0A0Q3N5_9CAUD|nr:hypothetical protein AVV36_gp158 [Pectobacterium bacteriophage PM2]AHY25252.1 hypothetical protein PM2_290 [Pectobacterium bacteriophage PM2]
MAYAPHQERVILEHQELETKYHDLGKFISTSPIFAQLDDTQRKLLEYQHFAMGEYLDTLVSRISYF